jgi:hypothetical protein
LFPPLEVEQKDECLYLSGITPDFQAAEVVRTETAYGDGHVASGVAQGWESRTFAAKVAVRVVRTQGLGVISITVSMVVVECKETHATMEVCNLMKL